MCDINFNIIFDFIMEIVLVPLVGAALASWLVRSSPDRAVRVRLPPDTRKIWGIFGNSRKMFESGRLALGQLLENLWKSQIAV